MHTSTVTVAVLSPNNNQEKQTLIDDKDLNVSWFSGTGAGGQHRNKRQNSCRITHIPTGIVAMASTRSRETSYREAMISLEQRLQQRVENAVSSEISRLKKNQVGSGMRGDKFRTYRFQDDRVKDHNSNKSASCSIVLDEGKFDLLW